MHGRPWTRFFTPGAARVCQHDRVEEACGLRPCARGPAMRRARTQNAHSQQASDNEGSSHPAQHASARLKRAKEARTLRPMRRGHGAAALCQHIHGQQLPGGAVAVGGAREVKRAGGVQRIPERRRVRAGEHRAAGEVARRARHGPHLEQQRFLSHLCRLDFQAGRTSCILIKVKTSVSPTEAVTVGYCIPATTRKAYGMHAQRGRRTEAPSDGAAHDDVRGVSFKGPDQQDRDRKQRRCAAAARHEQCAAEGRAVSRSHAAEPPMQSCTPVASVNQMCAAAASAHFTVAFKQLS